MHGLLDADFTQIAFILLLAAVAGGLAQVLRQPLVIAYIAVGIVVGPALGLVTATEQVSLLAEVGIAVLLFLVGLKLDLHLIRTTGPVALVVGVGQVVLTAAAGFGLAVLLGFDAVPALYVALALTFSSTIVIVKLLSDTRELEQLHGRISVGVLIVQDLLVILVMIVVTALGDRGDTGGGATGEVLTVALRGVAFLVGVGLLSRYVLARLLHHTARNPELLVLSGLAWAVATAAVSDRLGLSMEVGAFLAGVSLASTAYREALGARLVSLRDILVLFFFVDLSATMEFSDALDQLGPALALSVFVLVWKPLVVLVLMGLLGYRKKVSFLTGATLAQTSEFSLILTALGLSLGHVDSAVLGLVTVVALITIALSTYLILSGKKVYRRLAPALSVFERSRAARREHDLTGGHPYDAIVVGAGRFGGELVRALHGRGDRLLVVELDPHRLALAQSWGIDTLYGDATEPELAAALPLDQASLVISTVPELAVNLLVLESVRARGYTGPVAVTTHHPRDAQAFEGLPRVLVLQPHVVAAERVLATLSPSA